MQLHNGIVVLNQASTSIPMGGGFGSVCVCTHACANARVHVCVHAREAFRMLKDVKSLARCYLTLSRIQSLKSW